MSYKTQKMTLLDNDPFVIIQKKKIKSEVGASSIRYCSSLPELPAGNVLRECFSSLAEHQNQHVLLNHYRYQASLGIYLVRTSPNQSSGMCISQMFPGAHPALTTIT